MRELRSFQSDDKHDHYWAFKNDMVEALELLERGQLARAKQIWQRAYEKYPEQASRSQSAVKLLLRLQLYDELEQLLARGLKRYPSDVWLLAASAQTAYERGNLDEALLRSETLRKKHPFSDKGYWIAAAALSQLNRPEEAEAIFVKALKILPNDAALLIEYAKLAERKKDWGTALERWNTLFALCGHLAGISGGATALARLGRFDEADTLIASVVHRAGTDDLVWMASARVAEARGDWEEAARRWAIYRNRFPLLLTAYSEALTSLRQLGRHTEIEDVLRDGMDRFPEQSKLLLEYAMLAHRRHDWDKADERWARVRTLFPRAPEGYIRGAEALDALGRTEAAQDVRRRQPK